MDNDTIQIIPTCVPKSADDVRANIAKVSTFAGATHLDIDDGIFTPAASWPFEEKGRAGDLHGALDTPVDNFLIQAHLMVSEGRELGEQFIRVGVRTIVAHVESLDAHRDTFDAWRSLGVREIGIAILLDTPIEHLDPLLPFCDFIHVLSVATIGAQGAPFDPRAIDRVKELRTRIPSCTISVDGGVSMSTIAELVHAGATRFSVGSAIMHAADPALAYAEIKTAAEHALQ